MAGSQTIYTLSKPVVAPVWWYNRCNDCSIRRNSSNQMELRKIEQLVMPFLVTRFKYSLHCTKYSVNYHYEESNTLLLYG